MLRFLIASVALATMYWGMGEVWSWGAVQLGYSGWRWDDPVKTYAQEAERIAVESTVREAALSSAHRQAVFRLGVRYGYVGVRRVGVGTRTAAPGDTLDRDLAVIGAEGQFLGIAPVELPPFTTAAEAYTFAQRLEDDVGGVAARIEQATSARLRHLFMVGALAGGELALLDEGELFPAPILLPRHAVVSGIPPPLWRAITRVSRNRTGAARDYRAAVDAIERYLSPREPTLAK